MKKDKNILVVMPVKDEHKKTLEQHSQGNKFIYSSYDNVTQEMVQEANVIIGNAVSYKHLDVYKRQTSSPSIFVTIVFHKISILSFFFTSS